MIKGLDNFFGMEEKIFEIRKELIDEKFRFSNSGFKTSNN